MFIIGELINGMYQNISKAIKERNAKVIQDCALEQVKAGADALDINCGPGSKNPIADICWLIEVVQEVVDKPLCLDSSKPEVIEAGLRLVKNKAIINSTTADQEKLKVLVFLGKQYNAGLIGLTISKNGIPQNNSQRLELAMNIVSYCLENNFPIEELYLDPVVLPLNVAQAQLKETLEAIQEFKIICQPSPKTILGLSNISQGTKNRSLINRTFLIMAIFLGLDSAILNPLDKDLMDSLITAELILNKQIYCDSYLEAYRKNKI